MGSISELDKSNIAASLLHFPDQCKQGWDEIMKLDIPDDFRKINNIAVFAMGGSRLGAVIASHLYRSSLRVPFNYFAGYEVPAYVDENTLALVISNSGNTEETLSSYEVVKQKTKKVLAITKGGKLGPMAQADGFPVYLIDDREFNPASVPRVAVGFQLGAYFAILSKLRLENISESEFLQIIERLREEIETIKVEIDLDQNPAKQLAEKVKGKVPIIISSEHLFGAANVINNQTNESGKTFSAFFELPEVNHHQLEGMEYPKSNPENLIYFLLESNLYHERNIKRYEILKNILEKLGIEYVSLKLNLTDKLGQALEAVQFGGYMTYYLGLMNEVDPAPNPYVDEFKAQLK